MSIEFIDPSARDVQDIGTALRQMNLILGKQAGYIPDDAIKTYRDIQDVVRLGLGASVFTSGDQIEVEKATAVTCTVGNTEGGAGITAASCVLATFINGIGASKAGDYEFTFNGVAWHYNGAAVTLSDYGITVTGTAVAGDEVVIRETTRKLVFDITDTAYDVPDDARYTHALSLLLHDCFANVVIDASELLYYVNPDVYPDGLPAGTYNITLLTGAYGGGTAQDGTYQFTTTQVVPAGGGIRHTTMGAYQSGGYTVDQIVAGKFATYNASKSVIESNLATTEGSGGTNLGTATARSLTTKSDNMNFTERVAYGSNSWEDSAMRQWLNSDAASGWWSAKTVFDMPVTSPAEGFLYGLDPSFVAALGRVRKRTKYNTNVDGVAYKDSNELVFLASMTEVGFGANDSVYETPITADGPRTTALALYTGAGNADRIKYLSGSARYWWLRGAYPGNADYERYVSSSGALNGALAYLAHGAVPGLCII